MPIRKQKQRPKKTLYDYINVILKNKNMDKAYELEKLFIAFKDEIQH